MLLTRAPPPPPPPSLHQVALNRENNCLLAFQLGRDSFIKLIQSGEWFPWLYWFAKSVILQVCHQNSRTQNVAYL